MRSLALIERRLRARLDRDSTAYATFRGVKRTLDKVVNAAGAIHRGAIRANPRRLYISLTGDCNLRCGACHYGRDFMPQQQLPWDIGRTLIEDASSAGMSAVRLYGGEPLLHKDIALYVEAAVRSGMATWVTTNGLLLDKRIEALHERGLRRVSVGLYGLDEIYDEYVARTGAFGAVSRNLERTRARFGPETLRMHFDWVLMRPTCEPALINRTAEMAERLGMSIYVNLIHYSLPYFLRDQGDGRFHFLPGDRDLILRAVDMLLEIKARRPGLVMNSASSLRSVPDWLMLGPQMKAPCTERELIWVGPDGTVQMCYVTFRLGDLKQTRLRDMLFTPTHHQAARDAYMLNCPNCHCSFETRVERHGPLQRRYAD
jgi:MoaA/NifB/PqqE/SkfB family radical SAM enzyme